MLVADFEDTANGANHPVTGTTVVTSNVWHHAAAIYDTATDTWRLYLDGILDRTLALGGNFTPRVRRASSTPPSAARMTTTGAAAGFFQGQVDEVAHLERRPQRRADRRQTRFDELTSGTGLIGRYGLNEGRGTTVGNSVAGRPNGTTVASPTWVAGFPRADVTPPAAPTGLTATRRQRSSSRSPGPPTASPTSPATASTARRRTPVPTTGTPLNGASLLTVARATPTRPRSTARPTTTSSSAVDTSGNASAASSDAVGARRRPAAGSALQLNGTNQYVTFGAGPGARRVDVHARDRGSSAPAPASARRTGTGGIASAIPLVTKGGAEAETPANVNMNYFLGIDAIDRRARGRLRGHRAPAAQPPGQPARPP